MINIINGKGIITGSEQEIIQDFNCLFKSLLEDFPEIVIGTIIAWRHPLEDADNNADQKKVNIVGMISEDFIKMNKERHGTLYDNKDN